jgi:hypothetical protein
MSNNHSLVLPHAKPTMPDIHYGKRRRGIADVTGKQNRVSETPYWGDFEDVDDDKKESEDRKSEGPPSTTSVRDTDHSTLLTKVAARSRRRKRPRAAEGNDSAQADSGTSLQEEKRDAKNDADKTTTETPESTSSVPTLQEASTQGVQEGEKAVSEPPPQQHGAAAIPQPTQDNSALQALHQLPKLEIMLSRIHATLESQFPLNRDDDGNNKQEERKDLQAQRELQTRNEVSIQRLETLCQQQAQVLQATTAKVNLFETNQNKELQGLAKEIFCLKTTVLSFENQEAGNPALKQHAESLKQRLAESHERERLYSKQAMELSNVNKQQESMILQRDARIQDYLMTSSRANLTYQTRITELSNAIKQTQLKAHALEMENKQYKNILSSYQSWANSTTAGFTKQTEASSPPRKKLDSVKSNPSYQAPQQLQQQQTTTPPPNFLAAALLLQEQQKTQTQTEGSSHNPVSLTSSFRTGGQESVETPPSTNKTTAFEVDSKSSPFPSTTKKKRSRKKEKRKALLHALLPSYDSLADDRLSPNDSSSNQVIAIDSP